MSVNQYMKPMVYFCGGEADIWASYFGQYCWKTPSL